MTWTLRQQYKSQPPETRVGWSSKILRKNYFLAFWPALRVMSYIVVVPIMMDA